MSPRTRAVAPPPAAALQKVTAFYLMRPIAGPPNQGVFAIKVRGGGQRYQFLSDDVLSAAAAVLESGKQVYADSSAVVLTTLSSLPSSVQPAAVPEGYVTRYSLTWDTSANTGSIGLIVKTPTGTVSCGLNLSAGQFASTAETLKSGGRIYIRQSVVPTNNGPAVLVITNSKDDTDMP